MQSFLFWLHIKILQSAPLNSTVCVSSQMLFDEELDHRLPLVDRQVHLAEIGLKKSSNEQLKCNILIDWNNCNIM